MLPLLPQPVTDSLAPFCFTFSCLIVHVLVAHFNRYSYLLSSQLATYRRVDVRTWTWTLKIPFGVAPPNDKNLSCKGLHPNYDVFTLVRLTHKTSVIFDYVQEKISGWVWEKIDDVWVQNYMDRIRKWLMTRIKQDANSCLLGESHLWPCTQTPILHLLAHLFFRRMLRYSASLELWFLHQNLVCQSLMLKRSFFVYARTRAVTKHCFLTSSAWEKAGYKRCFLIDHVQARLDCEG